MKTSLLIALVGVSSLFAGERPYQHIVSNLLLSGRPQLTIPDSDFRSNAVPVYVIEPTEKEKDVWIYDMNTLDKRLLKDANGVERPFWVRRVARPFRTRMFYFGKVLDDREMLDAWRARHPGFRGFLQLEWVNDSMMPWHAYVKMGHRKDPVQRVTPEQAESIRHRPEYVAAWAAATNREVFARTFLKDHYRKVLSMHANDIDRFWMGDGIYTADHLLADWGVKGIVFETTENYSFWQIPLMFVRGAATQYDLDFIWYVASFYRGIDSDGTISGNNRGQTKADEPTNGLSSTAMKRVMYLAYLSGALGWQREGGRGVYVYTRNPDEAKNGTYGPEGRLLEPFGEFVKANPRGESVRTAAIVVPISRGYSRFGGKAFRRFDYTRGEYTLDALMSTILDYPANLTEALYKSGTERVMANSKYGDVFDVLCPDGERRETFAKALAKYKVAIVVDDFREEDRAALEKDLAAFAAQGGKVVRITQDLVPWTTPEAALATVTGCTCAPVRYPEIERRLDEAVLPTLPFKVKGPVQFGFNRLADGWLVYLINNGGVVKFGDRAEQVAPGGDDVTVDFGSAGDFEVRELLTGRTVGCVGDRKVSVMVPHGDVRVLKLVRADPFAAAKAEASRYWKRITGREMPEGALTFAIDPSISRSGMDAYEIRSAASGRPSVRLTGSNVRSVWYALYDLLERRGGCGFFWDGDRVPHKASIDLSGLDVHEESRFEYRGIRYFAHRGLTRFQAEHWGPDDWKREIDWLLKKRMNLFMLRIGQDDLFMKAFPEDCAYPDPAKPLPGAEELGRYDNRSLFWSLQFRGELRKRIMDYAFSRGLMAPEDFGTMTHWYSRTPKDFLEHRQPPFLPQAGKTYGEPTGLVWDIRRPEWMDNYWKITETSVREYGSPALLHTIGVAERQISTNRQENLQRKVDWTNMLFEGARARFPNARLLLAGWDLYCMKTPEQAKGFLKHIPEDVLIWDYEADASINTNFTEWDVVGKRPYVFGVFLAYEAGLDTRLDYGKVLARERFIEGDEMCRGYIVWPESSHVDTLGLEWLARRSWNLTAEPEPPRLASRYAPSDAKAMERLWKETVAISTNNQFVWRWNAYLPVMRELHEKLVKPEASDRWSTPKPDTVFAALPEVVATLKSLEYGKDEFLTRDMVDVARVWADRLGIEYENRLFAAWFRWVDGKEGATDEACAAEVERLGLCALRYLRALNDILDQHTDFSVCDSLDRLKAVAPVANPDFGRVLIDNCVNYYCASHQAEFARHCYVPAFEAYVKHLVEKIRRGDRSEPDCEIVRAFRTRLLKVPLESLRSATPRTRENFNRALDGLLEL